MSDAAIDGWIAHTDADGMLATLRAQGDARAEQFQALVKWLRARPAIEDGLKLKEQIAALAQAKILSGSSKDEESLVATLTRENVDRMTNPPGDAVFLHGLGGSLTAGYIAYLRRIDNVDEANVALRFRDLSDSSKVAKRISRLSSPYVFRLTQQLAQVFSAIGLPGSYEESRARFVSEQVEALQATTP